MSALLLVALLAAAQSQAATTVIEGAAGGGAPTGLAPDGAGRADRPGEVTLWHAYRGAERDALEQLAEHYNQSGAGAHLKLLSIPYDALVDKVTAAVPRGRGPDLFISAHDTIGDWAEANILEPLDGQVDPGLLKEFFPETVPPLLYKERLYGLPLAFKSCALFYDPARVATPPRTTDALLAMARAQAKNIEGGYGLVYETGLLYFNAPLLFGFGGRLFADDGGPAIDNPGNIAAARFVQGLVQQEKLTPREVNGPLVVALVNQGKALFAINGPWMLGDLDPGVKVAVAKLPVVSATGQPMKPFLSVEAVMLSARGERKPQAFAVARWLATTAAKTRLLAGKQPVAAKAAWQAAQGQVDATLLAFRDQLVDTVATPNTPAMKSTWSQVDVALSRAIDGNEDPALTFADAQRKLVGILGTVAKGPVAAASHGDANLLFVLMALGGLAWIGFGVRRYGARKLVADVAAGRGAYAYMAPAIVAMAVLVLVPFGFGVGMGFYHHAWGRYSYVGLQNFVDILGGADSRFWLTLAVTVAWTAINVVLHLSIGVALALLLNRPTLRGRALYRVLLIVPWAVPTYITALIWKGMFHPEFGAVNALFGLQGFSWMAQPWSAFAANVVTNTWLGFPFMMVVTLGALQSIPVDLYEAAALDGASAWQRFTHITVPLLKPALGPAVVLGTVWTFNMFNVIYLVSGGAPDGKSDILITEAFRWAFERGQGGAFGYAAAYSTLIFLLLLGYTAVANRVTKNIEGSLS